MGSSTVFILNYDPHYRAELFERLVTELDSEIWTGDRTTEKIQRIENATYIRYLKYFPLIGGWYILLGTILLSMRNHDTYVYTGHIKCLSIWIALFVNRLQGKRSYLWTHGWYGSEGAIKRALKKIFYALSDGIFLYGDYAKALMIKEGIAEDKLHVIYNSIQYEKGLSLRRDLLKIPIFSEHFQNVFPTVLFIGRLTEVKKLDLLIEAQHVSWTSCPFNVVLIGDGPDRLRLENLSSKESHKGLVWFYGACYNEEEISQLVYNADLCVSPGFVGLTAIHSMSFGTPVITHDDFKSQMPEFEAILEGRTGSFFKKDSAVDLANSIINWLYRNPQKTESIIQNCFDMVDLKYNPNLQAETFKSVLSN